MSREYMSKNLQVRKIRWHQCAKTSKNMHNVTLHMQNTTYRDTKYTNGPCNRVSNRYACIVHSHVFCAMGSLVRSPMNKYRITVLRVTINELHNKTWHIYSSVNSTKIRFSTLNDSCVSCMTITPEFEKLSSARRNERGRLLKTWKVVFPLIIVPGWISTGKLT